MLNSYDIAFEFFVEPSKRALRSGKKQNYVQLYTNRVVDLKIHCEYQEEVRVGSDRNDSQNVHVLEFASYPLSKR
jgi:hypothetical protein